MILHGNCFDALMNGSYIRQTYVYIQGYVVDMACNTLTKLRLVIALLLSNLLYHSAQAISVIFAHKDNCIPVNFWSSLQEMWVRILLP